MAASTILTLTGGLALLGLGMRHALDADHVATIDGITFGLLERSPKLARWVGALFALGHGLVVTAIAVAVAVLAHQVSWLTAPPALVEGAPLVLLSLVGAANLRALLAKEGYQPVALKGGLLPARLKNSDHPVAILLVGVLFALMLDSAAQAAAWGYAASAQGGPIAALFAGGLFTFGMMLTATLYGAVMCHVLTGASDPVRTEGLRRAIGWGTVTLAFGVVGCSLLAHLVPLLGDDALMGRLGAFAVVALVAAGLGSWARGRFWPQMPKAPEATALVHVGRAPARRSRIKPLMSSLRARRVPRP